MSHKIESAPTGRASCRGCKQSIAKDTLRFGEEFVNQFSDDKGMSYRYWHLPCAATKMANELEPVLAAYEGEIPDRASIEALIAEHKRPPFPHAEHAPNGRSRCRACDETLPKGELRVAFERTFEGPMGPQKGAAYTHARCLKSYLATEKERGRETADGQALMGEIEAHSQGRVGADDLAAIRTALGL